MPITALIKRIILQCELFKKFDSFMERLSEETSEDPVEALHREWYLSKPEEES